MKVAIIETLFGILAFDEEDKLVGKALLPKKPQDAARIFAKIEAGRITDEIANLINSLVGRGYDIFSFDNESLAKDVHEKCTVATEVSTSSRTASIVRANPAQFAIQVGFVKNPEEFNVWSHNLAMELTKLRVKGAGEKRDLIVAQAVQTLDELDKTINMLMARVREWYGIHFPELDRLLEKHETYARLVVKLGSKDNFTSENLETEELPKSKAEGIAKVAEKSMGADLAGSDLEQIQNLCSDIGDLYQTRQNLESYLDLAMEDVAPNMKYLVGSLLGARLIAVAGGLTNLAKRPASTIQVLGAEKALFRSLKTGTRPPKHGLIFQHTLLHDAKRWQRGKIARALAGKLAIATRADAFGGGRHIGDELKAGMDKRIEEIREKYDQPPSMPEVKPRHEKQRRDKFRSKEKRRKHRRER